MATEPQTVVLTGNGTQAVTFNLAPNVYEKIQSVLVEVDTSASGDVSPTLTVLDQGTTPVADKTQSDVIDGGGSGRATWALRLADEVKGVRAFPPIGFYTVAPAGGNPQPAGLHTIPLDVTFAGAGSGIDLMDTTTLGPGAVFPKKAGMYAFKLRVVVGPSGAPTFGAGDWFSSDMSTFNEPPPENFWAQESTGYNVLDQPNGGTIMTHGFLRYMAPNVPPPPGPPNYISFTMTYTTTPAVNIQGDFSVQQVY